MWKVCKFFIRNEMWISLLLYFSFVFIFFGTIFRSHFRLAFGHFNLFITRKQIRPARKHKRRGRKRRTSLKIIMIKKNKARENETLYMKSIRFMQGAITCHDFVWLVWARANVRVWPCEVICFNFFFHFTFK